MSEENTKIKLPLSVNETVHKPTGSSPQQRTVENDQSFKPSADLELVKKWQFLIMISTLVL